MAYNRSSSGIEDWARDGFESKIVREVKQALAEAGAQHKADMNDLRSEMRHAKKKIEHINGFYTWLLEVYPETYVQYKSLMDLQKVGETT
jgi:hypothetical protein